MIERVRPRNVKKGDQIIRFMVDGTARKVICTIKDIKIVNRHGSRMYRVALREYGTVDADVRAERKYQHLAPFYVSASGFIERVVEANDAP